MSRRMTFAGYSPEHLPTVDEIAAVTARAWGEGTIARARVACRQPMPTGYVPPQYDPEPPPPPDPEPEPPPPPTPGAAKARLLALGWTEADITRCIVLIQDRAQLYQTIYALNGWRLP